MTRNFVLSEIDCANCAAKIERKICKIKGVQNASVAFFTKKVTITASEADFERILTEARTVIRKIEPGCELIDL